MTLHPSCLRRNCPYAAEECAIVTDPAYQWRKGECWVWRLQWPKADLNAMMAWLFKKWRA